MTEREKIIEILKRTSDLWKEEESHGYIVGVDLEKIADVLIEAVFGDVTAHEAETEYWKTICKIESDEHHTVIKNAAEHARHLMQERDKYKHRAEVAEERLEKLKKTDGDLTIEDEINILENIVEEAKHRSFVFERELVKYKMAFDKAIKLAYKIRTDFDVLSCSSCEFGYAIDVCKKTGLYGDCENRWKEELLQQAEREIEEEKI